MEGLRIGKYLLAVGFVGLLGGAGAMADELDVTMDVVDSDATEERVVRELRIPEPAAEAGREPPTEGLGSAPEARERGREFGQERAESARERGRDARERGSDARGHGRGPDHDRGRPESPGPPAAPPGSPGEGRGPPD